MQMAKQYMYCAYNVHYAHIHHTNPHPIYYKHKQGCHIS